MIPNTFTPDTNDAGKLKVQIKELNMTLVCSVHEKDISERKVLKKVEELTEEVKELGREVKVKYVEGKNNEEDEEEQKDVEKEEEKDEEEKMEIKREQKREKRKKKIEKKKVVKMGLMKANGEVEGLRGREVMGGVEKRVWTSFYGLLS